MDERAYPLRLAESLRMEAMACGLFADASRGEWQAGMQLLKKKLDSAADELERLYRASVSAEESRDGK